VPAKINVVEGDRFGKLTVLGIRKEPRKNTECFVQCDCGSLMFKLKHNLTSGHTKSCGCDKVIAGEARLKHGHSKVTNQVSRTYKSWSSMKWRCGRQEGYLTVRVCDRWQSFENFLADMGERPEGKSIGRINFTGDYEPDNCRWATILEQARNRKVRELSAEGLIAITNNLPNMRKRVE